MTSFRATLSRIEIIIEMQMQEMLTANVQVNSDWIKFGLSI